MSVVAVVVHAVTKAAGKTYGGLVERLENEGLLFANECVHL